MDVPGQSNGGYRILAEINMIPFIDITLVLLIIFMVMTPFLVKHQLKVDLPGSKAVDQAQEKEQTIDIQITRDGTIAIGGRPVAPERLDEELKREITDPASQTVMVEADKAVSFERVVLVMGSAKKLGVLKLGIRVTRDGATGAGGRPPAAAPPRAPPAAAPAGHAGRSGPAARPSRPAPARPTHRE